MMSVRPCVSIDSWVVVDRRYDLLFLLKRSARHITATVIFFTVDQTAIGCARGTINPSRAKNKVSETSPDKCKKDWLLNVFCALQLTRRVSQL